MKYDNFGNEEKRREEDMKEEKKYWEGRRGDEGI
jgi:hypothetical protein